MNKKGFTIVELLIVIVVIAILAAISIVAYNGIQDRANNTVVVNDLSTISKKIEIWKLTNGNVYPTNSQLGEVGISVSKPSYLTGTRNNFYYCVGSDQQQYAFGVVSRANQGYFLTNGKITMQNSGATYQSDTCIRVGWSDGSSGFAGYITTTGWAPWTNG